MSPIVRLALEWWRVGDRTEARLDGLVAWAAASTGGITDAQTVAALQREAREHAGVDGQT